LKQKDTFPVREGAGDLFVQKKNGRNLPVKRH